MPVVIKTNNVSVDDVFETSKASVRLTMVDSDIVAKHVDRDTLPKHSGLSYNEPKITQPEASVWNEGEPHPEATLTSSNLQITPALSGLKIIITKRHMEMASEDLGPKIGKVQGVALGQYKDKNLISLFDSFTASLPGAGSALTLGNIRAARARIRTGNSNAGSTGEPYNGNDFHGILHPYQMHDLLESAGGGYGSGHPTMDQGIPGELIKKYATYELAGITFEEDANLVEDASNDTKGAVFAREAIRLVDFNMPDLDKEYDKDTGSWIFYADQDFGSGLYSLVWGTEIYSDITVPTA